MMRGGLVSGAAAQPAKIGCAVARAARRKGGKKRECAGGHELHDDAAAGPGTWPSFYLDWRCKPGPGQVGAGSPHVWPPAPARRRGGGPGRRRRHGPAGARTRRIRDHSNGLAALCVPEKLNKYFLNQTQYLGKQQPLPPSPPSVCVRARVCEVRVLVRVHESANMPSFVSGHARARA